jgi:MinD-like ATPase involved in chromosome partitioning or flagellar assembly
MSLLFITAGTKGGIGKTFTATMLADIAISKKQETVLYDCDNENESLKKAYAQPAKNCRLVSVDLNATKTGYPLDIVVNDIVRTEKETKGKKPVVYLMDMKAGTTHYTLDWMCAFPFSFIRSLGVQIFIVGCVTSDVDSAYTLSRWLYRFTDDMKNGNLRFLIVKNGFQGTDFTSYNNILKDFVELESCFETVTLPELEPFYMKPIKENSTSFGQVAMGKSTVNGFDFMAIYRIKENFEILSEKFASVWQALDKK